MEISLTVRLTEEEIRHAIEDYLTVKGIKTLRVSFISDNINAIEAEVKGEPIGSTDTTRNKVNRG